MLCKHRISLIFNCQSLLASSVLSITIVSKNRPLILCFSRLILMATHVINCQEILIRVCKNWWIFVVTTACA